MELFTIGHSAHPIDRFVSLLKMYKIQALVDVRSTPASRFHPQFGKQNLEKALQEQGIQYHYLGGELGGRPKDPALYPPGTYPAKAGSPAPRPDFSAIMQQPWFVEGIAQLLQIARIHTTAILCSEEHPANCHRHHLIAEYLKANYPEVLVEHIRGDGTSVNFENI